VGARLVVRGVVIHAHLAHHTHLVGAGQKEKGEVSRRVALEREMEMGEGSWATEGRKGRGGRWAGRRRGV
jgi:hypothetical protein